MKNECKIQKRVVDGMEVNGDVGLLCLRSEADLGIAH